MLVIPFVSLRSAAAALLALSWIVSGVANAQVPGGVSKDDITDEALVASLPGFKNSYAEVNGIRLHYVIGGKGEAVVLLPGWPQTWWSYRELMPTLAQRYQVIAVDIRGMGSSSKPEGGYDKKTMASDIEQLLRELGIKRAHIVGHDIGAQVAWSFAANHPSQTRTLTMLDVPHPDEELLSWPMLPVHNTFTDKIDERYPYVWWFAFHQVKGLPEKMLEGRAEIEHEWFFRYLMKNEAAIDAKDRAVYASAYNQEGGIRAGNAWYQAFTQDVIDEKTYAPLIMPVLGIAGPGYGWLRSFIAENATNGKVFQLPNSGHFVAEEAPEETLGHLLPFLEKNSGR